MSPSHPAPRASRRTRTSALREIKRTHKHTNSNRQSCRHNSGTDPLGPHSLRLAPLQTLPSSLHELFPALPRRRRSLRTQSTQTRRLTRSRMQLTLRGSHQRCEVAGTGALALLCSWQSSRVQRRRNHTHTRTECTLPQDRVCVSNTITMILLHKKKKTFRLRWVYFSGIKPGFKYFRIDPQCCT